MKTSDIVATPAPGRSPNTIDVNRATGKRRSDNGLMMRTFGRILRQRCERDSLRCWLMLDRRSSLIRERGRFDVGQLRKPVLMLAAICWLMPQFCFASGYAIRESSADAMGTAYAGSAATSTDASYMAFNPASLGSA